VGGHIPLEVHEVPTGKQVFDWTIPKEWNIKDAYIKNSRGDRVVDFRQSNLHVVSYSMPVRTKMSLEELKNRTEGRGVRGMHRFYPGTGSHDIRGICDRR
jgi:aminopeptidase-like protein